MYYVAVSFNVINSFDGGVIISVAVFKGELSVGLTFFPSSYLAKIDE